mmetsp:Transcript_8594/g.14815  ORF Transcript_8594/g.14815 Transcript_8594/m.14815 type:complete len:249 (-) Transcript_8594:1104-1850(-)
MRGGWTVMVLFMLPPSSLAIGWSMALTQTSSTMNLYAYVPGDTCSDSCHSCALLPSPRDRRSRPLHPSHDPATYTSLAPCVHRNTAAGVGCTRGGRYTGFIAASSGSTRFSSCCMRSLWAMTQPLRRANSVYHFQPTSCASTTDSLAFCRSLPYMFGSAYTAMARWNEFISAWALWCSKTKPLPVAATGSNSWTVSLRPPVLNAMTGVPATKNSCWTMPPGSKRDGMTPKSDPKLTRGPSVKNSAGLA